MYVRVCVCVCVHAHVCVCMWVHSDNQESQDTKRNYFYEIVVYHEAINRMIALARKRIVTKLR